MLWYLFGCAFLQNPSTTTSETISPHSTTQSGTTQNLSIPQIPVDGLEFSSPYSTIVLRDDVPNIRSLYFVRDSGEIVLETSVNLEQPHILEVPYTQAMFVSEVFVSAPIESSLLIGLGGGAMVHYIHHYWPEQILDAVEIDPVIVDIAKNYFHVPYNQYIRLHIEDGFAFIHQAQTKGRTYDVIYMDAFLKPSNDTDSTGVPLRLKTLAFYEELQAILKPDGVVVFNINQNNDINEDISNIAESFEQVWKLPIPRKGNIIVVACTTKTNQTTLQNRTTHLYEEKGISLGEWVQRLQVWSMEKK